MVGIPCNQFGEQEPGTADEIKTFCSTNYDVTFPLSEKIEVNGDGRHPLYQQLTPTADAEGHTGDIRWNFEKFLVSRDGDVIARFSPARRARERRSRRRDREGARELTHHGFDHRSVPARRSRRDRHRRGQRNRRGHRARAGRGRRGRGVRGAHGGGHRRGRRRRPRARQSCVGGPDRRDRSPSSSKRWSRRRWTSSVASTCS